MSNKSKKKSRSKAQSKAIEKVCDLCLHDIEDEEDILQCEGKCQGRPVHRYCAGITVSHYIEIQTSSTPFVCHLFALNKPPRPL